jgi:MoaA/NifB/PqqE/SkfB family radical SAM enzyme
MQSFHEYVRQSKVRLQDAVLFINTDFTYRAGGVINFLHSLQRKYNVKAGNIVLGGISAVLIPEFFQERLPGVKIYSSMLFKHITGVDAGAAAVPLPLLDVYRNLRFIPFRLSGLCPDDCDYCASKYIREKFPADAPMKELPVVTVREYLEHYTKLFKTRVVIPIDDALMVNVRKIQKAFADGDYSVYTPNGLHLKYINKTTASLLYKLGFKELRFGVETLSGSLHKYSSYKIRDVGVKEKINILVDAGFMRRQIRFYIMYGLEEQKYEDVKETVRLLKELKCRINVSGYSPVPHTSMYERLNKKLHGLFEKEPGICNNNTVPLWNREFSEERIKEIKKLSQP